MIRLALALLLLFPAAPALAAEGAPTAAARSVSRHERSVAEVADGVYVILHRDGPDTNPQGNTTDIVGDRALFEQIPK